MINTHIKQLKDKIRNVSTLDYKPKFQEKQC
jgi:hypothetical protein